MALALYRKYRPRTFAEVIGQEHVTEPLSQALRSGRLHHAYLFSGPRGCGKTSSARILARSLNCEQGPTPEPCGHCASCRSLANDGGGSIDVIEIDAASHGGVDDARDLREKAFFAPASSRYKIYVIDEAHMVSSAGFNALLKLVEEPPDYVKFIFATTEPEKVLGTIRSRTHHYPFRLIPPATLRPYLAQLCEAEGVHVDQAVFPLVVRAGGGSARDTLSVLDQLIAGAGPEGVSYARAVALLGVTDVALIDEMCDAVAAGDGAAAYRTIDRVAEAGHDPRRFASDLLERFRDLIIMQQVPDAVEKGLIDGPADQLERMTGQTARLGPATLSRCADIVHNGLVEMRGTTAPRLLLELITARMLLPGAEDSTGALLHRLERMERRLTLNPGAAGPAPVDDHPGVRATPAPAAPQPVAAPPSPTRQAGAPPVPSAPSTGAGDAATGPTDRSDAGQVSADPGGAGTSVPRASTAAPTAHAAPDTGAIPVTGAPIADGKRPDAGRPDAGVPGAVRSGVEPSSVPPDAVLPDAPLDAPAQVTDSAPGQLSAAAIRDTWPEIVTMVSRKSKKVAALAQGATVRDLDGQTVVLTFRFPAHARMVAAQPDLLSDALYEILGGRWQIRCEVAGEGGNSATAGRPGPPAAPGSASTVRQRDAVTQPAGNGDGTAHHGAIGAPGGGTTGGGASGTALGDPPGPRSAAMGGPAGGSSAMGGPAGGGSAIGGQTGGNALMSSGAVASASHIGESRHAATTGAGRDDGAAPSGMSGTGMTGSATTAVAVAPDEEDWPEPARPGGLAPADHHSVGRTSVGDAEGVERSVNHPRTTAPHPAAVASAVSVPAVGGPAAGGPAVSAPAAGGRTPGFAGRSNGPSAGLAAARAAAARGAGARSAAPEPAGAWSDGSPAEEPPYDPDYDGPVRGAAARVYEGFDPGDEPLDDVIDEKTARQSSEQQAMQLLQEAFGAEKIGEA
ncbi:MAG TPA: DNA polymerase III subunit gamma and tau [Actinoplanes sp.]